MEIEALTSKTRVKKLLDELNKMCLKYEKSQSYEAYHTFEEFVRPSGVSISDYATKFEQPYFMTKPFNMEIWRIS